MPHEVATKQSLNNAEKGMLRSCQHYALLRDEMADFDPTITSKQSNSNPMQQYSVIFWFET